MATPCDPLARRPAGHAPANHCVSPIRSYSRQQPAIHDDTTRLLADLGICYHHLAITRDKHNYILDHGIQVLFDDTDGYFQHLDETVTVFKTRQRYNFDFRTGRWLYTEETGSRVAMPP